MCQCDLSSHLSLYLWRGRVWAATPLSCILPAWIFSWKCAPKWAVLGWGHGGAEFGDDEFERGRRGDGPGGTV